MRPLQVFPLEIQTIHDHIAAQITGATNKGVTGEGGSSFFSICYVFPISGFSGFHFFNFSLQVGSGMAGRTQRVRKETIVLFQWSIESCPECEG